MPMVGQRQMMNHKKWGDYCREQLCSLLFPRRCPVCEEILEPEDVDRGIHSMCESKWYPVEGISCMHCGRPLGDIERKNTHKFHDEYLEYPLGQEYCFECQSKGYVSSYSRPESALKFHQNHKNISAIQQGKSLYLYRGDIKKTMYRFKYSNKREYADFFAQKAVERYGAWIAQNKIEVIIPIPMYAAKKRKRGYNQAESFARALSKATGIPVDTKILLRVKDTTPQKGLNDVERKNNLKNAFQKGKSIVQYSHVLVVDDIYTTGSTAQAAAKELIKIGGCRVYFMSICIGGDR